MAKQAISYPLRVYDEKLWKRLIKKAKENKNSLNAQIEIALNEHLPENKNVKS